MALLTEEKKSIVQSFRRNDLDTGSPEVQIALLSARIRRLTEHFKSNKQDHHGRRGLAKMVSKRRKLLDYLKANSVDAYKKILVDLEIRK